MMLCGEQLDNSKDSTLQELRAALKKSINQNAQLDAHRITPEGEERRSRNRENRVREGFCKHPDYQAGKAIMFFLLQPEQVTAIRKRLESQSDPMEGECL